MRFDQLARLTGGTLYNADDASRRFRGVAIDSRKIRPGQLFVALSGGKKDGHDFIADAIAKGAAGVISEFSYVRFNAIAGGTAVVAVKDSHDAMMLLAERYRETSHARFVGITGSNGKTTTKELAYRLIRAVDDNVYRSPGNFNNLYGAPLALFAMPEETSVAVMEMGISVPGEMTRLTRIVKPDVIVITNVGPSHLQFLHSVEGVARAKLEVVKNSPEDVPVIINGDDPVLVSETGKLRRDIITFAVKAAAAYSPARVESHPGGALVEIENNRFRLQLFGVHQVYNLLAAYAAFRTLGYAFGSVDTEEIPLSTAPMRGEMISGKGVTFIADCYNANPDSVKSALLSFAGREGGRRRVIILGDMLELGEAGERYHREAGRMIAGMHPDLLVLVGPLSRYTMQEASAGGLGTEKILHYMSAADCVQGMLEYLKDGDLVLVKGSRGIGLEAVVEAWRSDQGEA